MSKNVTCPECGKQFHACRSCGLIHEYEYEYCSLECYQKSLKYEDKKNNLVRLIKSAKQNIINFQDLYDYIDNKLDEDELMIFLTDPDIAVAWYVGENNE